MNLAELLSLAIFAIFAENFVLVQFLGVDSFLSLSKKWIPRWGSAWL